MDSQQRRPQEGGAVDAACPIIGHLHLYMDGGEAPDFRLPVLGFILIADGKDCRNQSVGLVVQLPDCNPSEIIWSIQEHTACYGSNLPRRMEFCLEYLAEYQGIRGCTETRIPFRKLTFPWVMEGNVAILLINYRYEGCADEE